MINDATEDSLSSSVPISMKFSAISKHNKQFSIFVYVFEINLF